MNIGCYMKSCLGRDGVRDNMIVESNHPQLALSLAPPIHQTKDTDPAAV
jgi:hypothetical protein